MRGFLFGRWKLGEGVVLLRFLWDFRARTKRTEILYIFFGIHTASVVKLADRIEQRVSLAAASLRLKTFNDNPYLKFQSI